MHFTSTCNKLPSNPKLLKHPFYIKFGKLWAFHHRVCMEPSNVQVSSPTIIYPLLALQLRQPDIFGAVSSLFPTLPRPIPATRCYPLSPLNCRLLLHFPLFPLLFLFLSTPLHSLFFLLLSPRSIPQRRRKRRGGEGDEVFRKVLATRRRGRRRSI